MDRKMALAGRAVDKTLDPSRRTPADALSQLDDVNMSYHEMRHKMDFCPQGSASERNGAHPVNESSRFPLVRVDHTRITRRHHGQLYQPGRPSNTQPGSQAIGRERRG
jgi:hypothetical protein